MTQIAMCRCGTPLVSTFAFRKFEFYCLDCGRRYGYLDPQGADETPELLTRMEAVRAEFKDLSAGLIGDGGFLTSCPTCTERKESHEYHATLEERTAHEAARLRLFQRVLVPT